MGDQDSWSTDGWSCVNKSNRQYHDEYETNVLFEDKVEPQVKRLISNNASNSSEHFSSLKASQPLFEDSGDDEMSMRGIFLAVQVTKYTYGPLGIETLGTRIPKSSIFNTLIIKSTLIRRRMCIKRLSIENNIITNILLMETKEFLIVLPLK